MTTLDHPLVEFLDRRLESAGETIARLKAENAHLKKLANAGHVHRWTSYKHGKPFCLDCGASLETP